MTIHKPDYYDKFICIADKCMFTCCKDWKIGVDQYTKQKWGRMRIPDETVKRNNLAVETYLDDLVGNGGDSIKLCKNGRCPFLNEKDLCDIVLEYGEENISLTCHTYPRENHIYRNCNEMTLAMGCPAALDLLLESREFRYINQEDDKKEVEYLDDIDSKLVLLRDRLMAEFNNNRDIETTMKMLFYIMLECFEKEEVLLDLFEKDFFNKLQNQIEALDSDLADTFNEQNELFLDMAQNYREKKIYSDVLEPISQLAEVYEDELNDKLLKERIEFNEYLRNTVVENGRTFYDMLRTLVAEEVYSTVLLPEGDLYSMTMKTQWIAMEYAIICNALFLTWINRKEIDYSQFREIIAVIIRMTGYSEEDIEEYLESSFKEIIWDWGYMALIMG